MKRVCLIVLLVVSTVSIAQDKNRRDGNWWVDLPESEKLNHMVGFFDGMDLGYDFSYWGYSDTEKANCAVALPSGVVF